MRKNFIYFMLLFAIALAACKKEKALNVDITKSNLDTFVPGDIDKYLKDNFLDPYNIAVLYRFDRNFPKLDKEVTPVREDKIKLSMDGIIATFIQPYMTIAGKNFFKPKVPKQLALFGSAEYSDQQITLGTADAGRQINLFVLNDFDKNSPATFMQLFHTMHHEFGHILNQNIPVPPDYEAISSNYIGSAWVGAANPPATAKALGFITRYARNNKDEDFVEMIATMLAEGRDFFDAYVNTADALAQAKLRLKEQMVVDYYKTSFGIDFRALQTSVRTAIDTYGPASVRSVGLNFTSGSYNGFNIDEGATGQPAAFVTAYNTSYTAAAAPAFDSPIFPQFELSFTDTKVNRTDMILKFTDGTYNYWFNMKATVTGNNVQFARAAQGTTANYSNGTFIQVPIKPLLDYFTTKTFKMDWIEGTMPGSKNLILGFFDGSNNQLAFYGRIKDR